MSATHSEFGLHTDAFEVAKAFPDQIKGKTIIITGVNAGGIGGPTALSLASQGAGLLILAGRNKSKVNEVITTINKDYPNVPTRFLELDLSSQASARKAGKEILDDSSIEKVDILINSAGVMMIQERTLSPDGTEMQFATNHIGHYLFTNTLLPKLIKSASSSPKAATRIVNVSSRGTQYGAVRFSDLNFEKLNDQLPEDEKPNVAAIEATWQKVDLSVPYNPITAYAQSKTANVLFSVGLNSRLYEKHGILSLALHPGAINTELGRHSFPDGMPEELVKDLASKGFEFKSLGEGASTSLVAALDPKLEVAGKDSKKVYLSDCQIETGWTPDYATDVALGDKLWSASEEIVGEKFAY